MTQAFNPRPWYFGSAKDVQSRNTATTATPPRAASRRPRRFFMRVSEPEFWTGNRKNGPAFGWPLHPHYSENPTLGKPPLADHARPSAPCPATQPLRLWSVFQTPDNASASSPTFDRRDAPARSPAPCTAASRRLPAGGARVVARARTTL